MFKAYLWGQTILHIQYLNLGELRMRRLQLYTEFDLVTTNKAILQLNGPRQCFFEMGERAGKLLAHQARAEATSRPIPKIESQAGDIL